TGSSEMRRLFFILIWLIPVILQSGWIYLGPRGRANQILPTSDSGFIASGYLRLDAVAYTYLLKLNAYGDSLWIKTFGSMFFFQDCNDLKITSDSGYILAGYISPYHQRDKIDIYVVKTDPSGELSWFSIIGEENISEDANSIIQTYDGNFVIAGYKNSTISNWDEAYLLKINSTGDTIWTKTWGVDSLNDYLVELLETDDRGLIILGYSSNGFYSKIHLTKTDSLGDTIWTQILIDGGKNHASSIREVPGKGYVVLAYTSKFSGADDIFIIRTDYFGNTCWSQIYNYGIKDKAYSIELTPDGGFVVVGTTQVVDFDVYIMKIDSFGHKLWERTYGSNGHDEGVDISLAPDNGFSISGFYNYYYKDITIYIIKTDSMGVAVEENIITLPTRNCFSVNYLGNLRTAIRFSLIQSSQVRVDVYDLSGRLLSTPVDNFYPTGEYCIYWQVPREGVYFFRIRSNCLEQSIKALML
ncbi:MAG: hypothetical protein ACP5FK_12300, partial [bacterium]